MARAEAHLSLFVAKYCAIRSVDVVNKCFSDESSAEVAMHITKWTAMIKHVLMPYLV